MSFLSDLDPDKRFALLIVIIGCATGVICTIVVFISSTVDSIHRRRLEADMKRDMLDRGMSADDIAKIVEASPPQNVAERWVQKNR